MTNRLKISLALMLLTILLIAAFQFWWLRRSYLDESITLRLRTSISFRDAIHELQVSKLKIDTNLHVKVPNESDVVGVMNVLKKELRDSIKPGPRIRSARVYSIDKNSFHYGEDSANYNTVMTYGAPDKFFDILIGSDSLQDSISVKEIIHKYGKVMKDQNLNVPFTVVELHDLPSIKYFPMEPGVPEVTIGFLHPVTYRLILTNTFPYLIRKITSQLLFSIFLLGVTIIAFLSLYRNLMAQKKLAGIKNDFISNITHELKTPIATVSVAIEALKNFNALENPAKTTEYLDISEKELKRLTLLVDKVLKLSMFERKQIRLNLEQTDLKLLADEVISSMKLQIEKSNAKVDIQTSGDTRINGDRLHLLSVIYNLIDNALKYSREHPVILVEIHGLPDYVEFAVTDNGIGIPQEYRQKIFEKFFRVPSGDTHNAKGYGLGLSYAAYIVQLHHGEINIESQEGIGSRFTIKIPGSI